MESEQSQQIKEQYPRSIFQSNNSGLSDHDEFHRKYEEMETLGEGGAAVVKKCKNRKSGILFAVKQMRRYDEEKEASSR